MPDHAQGTHPSPVAWVDFPASPDSSEERLQRCFAQPLEWLVAHEAADVPSIVAQAHERARQGQWCVGWITYEAASAFQPALPYRALPSGQAYAVWAVFDEALPWPSSHQSTTHQSAVPWPDQPWQLGPWQAHWDEAEIAAKVEQIREWIQQGDVYQVNLTDRLQGPFQGDLSTCFHALHRAQPQGYACMLDARAAEAGAVLSASPELFFDWYQGVLTTRPMKGTAPRHANPELDQQAQAHLRSSPKERAENLMIVDLLRNDLSQIAETGSVQVPSLFDIQALPTVWQMTSTVRAISRPNATLTDILAALFPCGSVTGAPKRQAMLRIQELEPAPRGVYCGACGIMQPGGRVTFNVPIRTVQWMSDSPEHGTAHGTAHGAALGTAYCGIGSGITLDSTGTGEAAEWRAKQAFLKRAQQPFDLLESLRLENGVLSRRPLHLKRVLQAAHAFHFAPGEAVATLQARIESALDKICQEHPEGCFKVRLLVNAQGDVHTEAAPLPPNPAQITVALAQEAMPPADAFIWHKTTFREAYAKHPVPSGCFDTLLYNQAGEVTEFTIGNVAVELDGRWVTPPLACGLLPGVMRQTLLAQGRIEEATIHLDELHRATGLALINSVRGWLPAQLLKD